MLGDPLVFILQSMISPPTYIHLPHYTCHLPHDSAALLVVSFVCCLTSPHAIRLLTLSGMRSHAAQGLAAPTS